MINDYLLSKLARFEGHFYYGVNMKFFNGLMGFVFIVAPAVLWWVDCWTTMTTPKEKYEEVVSSLEIQDLLNDMDNREALMEAFHNKKISRSEYIREMEKLQKKVEREGKKTKKKVEKSLK